MLVPWPPMNFVAEWTTMSAPHSIGPAEVRRRERVVDHQRRLVLVRDRGDRLEVEYVAARVADRLPVEDLRVLARRSPPRVRVVRVDPGEVDVQLPQQVLELVDGAAVEG